jgi:hypothetical protein
MYGLEMGPAPERSRSWTSWTSYIMCHHWIPPTVCYVLGAPRIRWGGVREALGGGVMQSVCSRKPPYTIHEDLRDSTGKGSEKIK